MNNLGAVVMRTVAVCAFGASLLVASPLLAANPYTRSVGFGTWGDFDAQDGVLCKTHTNIPAPYLDDGVTCQGQDDSTYQVGYMKGVDTVALGTGNRIWGIRGHDLVVDLDGQEFVVAQLPENGVAQDLILLGSAVMVNINGHQVALDAPLVRMDSRNYYEFIFPEMIRGSSLKPGWNLGFEKLRSVSLANGKLAFFIIDEAGKFQEISGFGLSDIPLPSISTGIAPRSGTAVSGVTRLAVSDLGLVLGDTTFAPLLEGTTHLDAQFNLTYTWQNLVDWSDPFVYPPNTPTQYIDFNLIHPDELECAAGAATCPPGSCRVGTRGCGIGKFLGGNRGFDHWGAAEPGQKVHGFYVTTNVRGYVILEVPPAQSFAEAWLNGSDQIPAWATAPTTPPTPGSRLVTVDPLGGPVYEVSPGWSELPAVAMPTYRLPQPRENLALDVFVPAGASGYVGDIQLSGELRAAGVWDTYIGYQSLDSVARGTWVTLTFPLPAALKTALAGDYPGAVLRTDVDSALSGVRVRGLRVSGTAPSAPRASHAPTLSGVRSNAFLDFEHVGDWTSQNGERNLSNASQGILSERLSTSGYTELTSRTFATNELPPIGATLTMDVYTPAPAAALYWLGSIDGYLQCPSANVWGQWVGHVDLNNLFVNEWTTVKMPLSTSIQSALRSSARDCSLRFTVNTAETPQATAFLLDHLGFHD